MLVTGGFKPFTVVPRLWHMNFSPAAVLGWCPHHGIAPQGCSWKEPSIQLLGMEMSPPISPNCCRAGGVWASLVESLHPLKNRMLVLAVPTAVLSSAPGISSAALPHGPRSLNSNGLSRGSCRGSGKDGGKVPVSPYPPQLSLVCF